MQKEVYIYIGKNMKVSKYDVTIGDIANIWSDDKAVKSKVSTLKIYDFEGKNETRIIISALSLVEKIQKNIQNITVNLTGETDILVEYEKEIKKPKWMEYVKVGIICVILFAGAAFSIMAFNQDAAVGEMFETFYAFFMGEKSDGMTCLEFGYAFGLAMGIIVFYNHFGKKKLSKDPTPVEVEMRKYQQDISNTLIEGVKRGEAHIDVD